MNDQVSFLSVLSVQGLETKISLSGETGFPTTFRVMITAGGGGRVGGASRETGLGGHAKGQNLCVLHLFLRG